MKNKSLLKCIFFIWIGCVLIPGNLSAQLPELVLPIGHFNKINSVDFSPDGRYILSASEDGTAKIWETSNGMLLRTLAGHRYCVFSAFFSPICQTDPDGGKFIITSSLDGTIGIWETTSGKLLHLLGKVEEEMLEIPAVVSPDCRFIAAGYRNGMINVWDFTEGILIHSLGKEENRIRTIGFHPDGQSLITTCFDRTAKVWDVLHGTLSQTIDDPTSTISQAEFSPDGRIIMTVSNQNTVTLWENSTGIFLDSINITPSDITSVRFSPDSSRLVLTADDSFSVWDINNRELIKSLEIDLDNFQSAQFSPTGEFISVVSEYDENAILIYSANTGRLLNNLSGNSNEIISYSFSPDEANLAMGFEDGSIDIIGTRTGKNINTLKTKFTYSVTSSVNDQRNLFASVESDSVVRFYDLMSGRMVHPFKNAVFRDIENVYFSQDGRYLIIQSHNIDIYSLDDSVKIFSKKMELREESFTFNPEGNLLILAIQDTIQVWDLVEGSLLYSKRGHKSQINSIKCSADGKYIITASKDNTVKIWNLNDGKLSHTLKGPKDEINYAEFSPNSKFIVTRSDDYVQIWDAFSMRVVKTMNNDQPLSDQYIFLSPESKCLFSPDSKYLYICTQNGRREIRALELDDVVIRLNDLETPFEIEAFSADGNYFFSNDYLAGTINVWEVSTGKPLFSLGGAKHPILGFKLGSDGKFLYAFTSIHSSFSVWDLENRVLKLSLVGIKDGERFVYSPNGLFDATPGAMELLYWVKGLEIIELNQLKDRYWEPGLWEKVMNGEPIRDVRGMNELKMQPEVELGEVTDGVLPVTLTLREGGYGRVSLNINGKEVEADVRGSSFDPALSKQTIYYNLLNNPLLREGQDNILTVKAWSADGFVVGRGVEVLYAPPGDSSGLPPSLFAVVIGISDYSSDAIHLNYATPDAAAISKAITLGGESLFGKEAVFVYTLTSPGSMKPDKERIRNVFSEIKANAKPNDILIVYLSGHGITWGGETGDFYYLTSDAFSASIESYNDPAIRMRTAISTKEFTEWIKEIPALKQVMIIDACGSGKAVDNLIAQRNVDPSQIKSIDRMKDRTGMFIISGCAADAVSYEASRYGQGLLTYAILQAIKGAALREDRYVDVNTILNYAREQVPMLAEGIGGIQQPQVLIPKGGSFDIGIMDEEKKKQVPLAAPKPLYVRSQFLDADQLEDVLGLSAAVDDLLKDISSRGTENSIIFLDVRNYPDGCKISGTYTQRPGKITLRYKVTCAEKSEEYRAEGETVEEILSLIKSVID